MINRKYRKNGLTENNTIFNFLFLYGLLLSLVPFLLFPISEIFEGLFLIVTSPSNLISDYIHIAGAGATFVNSGLLTLSSLFLLRKHRHHFCNLSVSIIMLLSGFSFFGKNIVNSAPIILGFLIYLWLHHSGRQDLLVVGLLSTCLSPLVSIIYLSSDHSSIRSKLFALLVGLLIGYIIIPFFLFFKRHTKELNLYNMGFSAGVVGTLSNLFTRKFLAIKTIPHGTYFEHNAALQIFLILLFTCPIIFLVLKTFIFKTDLIGKNYQSFFRFSIYGYLGLIITLFLRVPLNGILVGTILTFAGFSMYNYKFHFFLFPALGVFTFFLFIYKDVSSTTTIVVLLFSSTLAPFTRKYGLFMGFISGIIYSIISQYTSILTAGINLYNCGFAGGITVLMVDFLRYYLMKHPHAKMFCSSNYVRLMDFERRLIQKFQGLSQLFISDC